MTLCIWRLQKTKRLAGLIFFSLSFFYNMSAVEAKDVALKLMPMTISFQAEESFVPNNFRERLGSDWEVFCEKFSKNFLIGKGPQGRGVANKVNCLDAKFVNDPDKFNNVAAQWNLHFSWKSKGLSLVLTHSLNKKDVLNLGTIDFPKQFSTDTFFHVPEATYYVLNRIYRRLPVAWSAVFQKTDVQWQLAPLDSKMLGVMSPARKVGLYALRFDDSQKIWIPTLYALAQPVVSDDSRKQFDREGGEPLELRWVINPRQSKMRLWAQEIYNPLEKEVDPSFISMADPNSKKGLLEGYALDGLKSNQVFLRYGMPFPKGTTVVSQASKLELIAYFGKGIIDGLTIGYEYSPRQVQAEEDDTYSFTWTRMEAGWSFELGEPQTIERFATRFKLAPKIGILNMDAYFPLNASENLEFATVAAFRVKNQIDLGGELSWELESLNYRIRLWGTAHLSGYVLGGANPTKISNQRAGGDISYDVYKTSGGMRFALLGFGYIDWVTVQQETTPQEGFNLSTSTTASGASYNVTFIGAGLSVTW